MQRSRDDGSYSDVTLLIVELVLVAAALGASYTGRDADRLPPSYLNHTLLIGATTMALVAARAVVHYHWVTTTALVGKGILWYFLAYPAETVVFPHVLVAVALLFDAWNRHTVRYAVPITVLLMVGVHSTTGPRIAYGGLVAGQSWDYVLFYAIVAVVVALPSIVLRNALETARCVASERDSMERAIEHLTDANMGYQRRVHDIAETSKQEERNRITRDIHDSIGYTVANVIVMIDAAIGLVQSDPDRAVGILADARAQANRGHAETRRTLHILRALEAADISGVGSIPKITATFASATGVAVTLDMGNLRTVYDGMIDSAIYRFVQEGMINAFRHGNAGEISIRMFELEDQIAVTIRDNGGGAQQIVEGIGIIGMRERMSQVGGTIDFQNTAMGFQISARVPLPSRSVAR